MTSVAKIGRHQIFNLSEAEDLFPTVHKITKRQYFENIQIEERLQRFLMADPRRQHYQEQFKENITQWKTKMEGLGVKVHSLWQIEFQVGSGSLCWEFPELRISHFLPEGVEWEHRIKLKDYIDSYDPDWAY
jgi:hypothetical protein